jgi:predicted XRE-type DNA-binding protein
MTETFASVWDALEDTAEAAANLKVRAALMREVTRWVQQHDLTQTEAASRLGVSQPRVSDLMRGCIDKFSVDALVNMLGAAGLEVRLTIVDRKAA